MSAIHTPLSILRILKSQNNFDGREISKKKLENYHHKNSMIEPITAIPYRDYNESSTVRPECFGDWTEIEDIAGIVASACEVYHDFPK